MNPQVFIDELIVSIELTQEEMKSANKPLNDYDLWMLQDSVRHLKETTLVLIDCLK